MKNFNKGFTLIELLVVIAIIGILSSVVLAALGGARSKAKVSALQVEMKGFTQEALLFNDTNDTFTGLFVNATPIATSTADVSVINILSAIEPKTADGRIYGAISPAGDEYALYARLPGITDPASVLAVDIWCVDSTGKSGNPTTDAVDPLVDAPNSQFDGLPATVCW